MADVLTREQLEAQLRRRRKYLSELEKRGADAKLIACAQKDLRMTEIRLERLAGEHKK